MRQKIIAGNWKMNGTPAETETLIGRLVAGLAAPPKATAVICPPYISLPTAAKLLVNSRIALGAQDMSEHEKGAFTGDISAPLLLTVGVTYVILGHSERRQYHAETDQLVNAKAKTAFRFGLTPIICVGETLKEREAGKTETVVTSQIRGSLDGFSADDLRKTVIAYEPVWAIGTGRVATPEQAEAVHKLIRDLVTKSHGSLADQVPLLYGGSVKGDNAKGLLAQPNIDGALVGGASLVAEDFLKILGSV